MTIPVTFSSLTDLHLLDSPTIPGTPWPGITIDIDNETRSSVSPTIGADEFSPLDSLSTVRPGDTDSSGVVDNYDLLPIGYYMGTYGHSRNQIAIDWQDKISKLWPAPNQSSGINRNHADANGDGWVDLSDVSAIASNYGLNYRLMNPEKLSSQSGHPELYLVPNKFTYVPGESVHIDVMLGTNTEPISEFRGIGFQLNINPTYIKQGTYSLQFGDNYICRFADCADFVRTSDFSGIAAGSLVKTDGIQAYGYGRIAELNFVIDDFVTTSAVIPILFLNYKGIDSNGDEMLLSVINDTIQVIVSSVFTTIPVSQPLIVYPNPAMNELNVILPHSCSKPVMIEISDLSGRNIRRNQIIPEENSNTLKFDIHSLNAGVYIIKVITDENRWTARFVKL